jgi:hypothetical protein
MTHSLRLGSVVLALAAFTSSTSSCGGCAVDCPGAATFVWLGKLPNDWIANNRFRLCVDAECTSSKAGDDGTRGPYISVSTPTGQSHTMSLTVLERGQRVFYARTTKQFPASKGGHCKCGGLTNLQVNQNGQFSKK